MNDKKKTIVIGAIAGILVIFNLIVLNKVSELKNEVINLNGAINSNYEYMSNYYNGLEELKKKEASIVDSIEVNYGELDTDNLTVGVSFKIVPKEYKDGLKGSLIFNNQTIELKNDGLVFQGIVNLGIFEKVQGKVIFDDGTTKKVETLEALRMKELDTQYLLGGYINFSGSVSDKTSRDYRRDGFLNLCLFRSETNSPQSIKYITEVNGDRLDELSREIDKDVSSYKIDDKITLSNEDEYICYILVEDKYGLTYLYIIDRFIKGNIETYNTSFDSGVQEIKNKDGKIVWNKDSEK